MMKSVGPAHAGRRARQHSCCRVELLPQPTTRHRAVITRSLCDKHFPRLVARGRLERPADRT
jgi:hypothetical protein